MKFRKKPIVIEATRWFKNGDHPEDACEPMLASDGEAFQSEGKVVRYFRHPDVPGTSPCVSSIPCVFLMDDHGWIDTPEGGYNVCPGDWIITGVEGETYPCKARVFEATYERVDEAAA